MGLTDKFLEYLQFEKKYSKHTVESYGRDLEDFRQFLLKTETSEDTKRVDKKIVRNFIFELGKKKLTNRTIDRKISALRSYYHFLIRIGELDASPLETIDSLKFYAEPQVPMSVAEMDRLQAYFETDERDLLSDAVIETLYQTGMRKAELCGLRFPDVDFGTGFLKVTGKGNKQRQIPISPNLAKVLKEYLSIRKPMEAYKGYFFINARGRKLTEKFVYTKVNFYLSMVSSKRKKSPHMLRHTFATHMLNNGANISELKDLLGHASLASTEVYTHTSIEQLRKVINQAHPRANKKDVL